MLRLFPIILCVFTLYSEITPSAIPVWELLSKDEKMSFLYSMFANQVENYCESIGGKHCNQELLTYGLRSLKDMSEDILDTMDPYQRGANDMIWTSLLEGHSLKNLIPRHKSTTTTPKPNSYDGDLSFGVDEYGEESAETSKVQNVYRVLPPKDFIYIAPSPLYTMNSDIPEYVKPHQPARQNELPFEDILKPTSKQNIYNKDNQRLPLTGPMEIKVYPDGTPVQEEPMNIPQDEDLQQYRLSKIRLPNV